jgi:choline monooxygenase
MPSRLPPFELDLSRAATLPAFAYTDAAILAAERQRIFRRSWTPVGSAFDVREPGSYLTGELAGAPVLVTRDAGGVLRGFYNVCRHRAGPVAVGKGSRKSLTCGYHGWSYALDGRLIGTPEAGEMKDFDRTCHGLPPVRAEIWGPIVFACLDEAAPPLLEILGKIPVESAAHDLGSMRAVARRDYPIACNWKVYVDNYLEGYHLPTVHPGLYRELDYANYRVDTFASYSAQVAPIRPATKTSAGRYYTPEDNALEALYYWVFPGWMLNIYPDNMSLNIVVPVAPDRCVTTFEWYRKDPDAPGVAEAIARTIAFSDEIQREDIGICETVQKGLASGSYERGRFSVARENGVHHFQSLVHAALTSETRLTPGQCE